MTNGARNVKISSSVAKTFAEVLKGWNANQPRVPAGSSAGGQFAGKADSAAAAQVPGALPADYKKTVAGKLTLSDKGFFAYLRALRGVKTSDGITITGLVEHAKDRIAQRDITESEIRECLQKPIKTTAGSNASGNTRKYTSAKQVNTVIDINTGKIVTSHRD